MFGRGAQPAWPPPMSWFQSHWVLPFVEGAVGEKDAYFGKWTHAFACGEPEDSLPKFQSEIHPTI